MKAKNHASVWGSLGSYLESEQVARPKSYTIHKTRLKPPSPQTKLSTKAIKLKIGMTRLQVKTLLGEPTWAQSYMGMSLDWTWRNGKCNPVDVTFNKKMFVSGFDEGWVQCSKIVDYTDLPADKHLCSNSANQSLCSIEQNNS